MNSTRNSKFDRAKTHLALQDTVHRICVKIRNGEFKACTEVKEYIETMREQQIVSLIAESLDESFLAFIDGLSNSFADIEYI
jgi:hypothetical protein